MDMADIPAERGLGPHHIVKRNALNNKPFSTTVNSIHGYWLTDSPHGKANPFDRLDINALRVSATQVLQNSDAESSLMADSMSESSVNA